MKERIDRRDLFRLGAMGALGGGASVALGSNGFAMFAPPVFETGKKVFSIFLRGGNDAVNMVIPDGDGDYDVTLRPTLHIPSTASFDLGNGYARAHPAMGVLFDANHPMYATSPWAQNKMALVHRVGYPQHSRSHFESMQNMETTKHFDSRFTQGFFARFAEIAGFHLPSTYNPVGAISVSLEQQMMFNGPPAVGHIKSVEAFALDPHMTSPQDYVKLEGLTPTQGLRGAYAGSVVNGNQWDGLVRGTGTTLFDALAQVGGPYVDSVTWTPCPYPMNGPEANCAGVPADGKIYTFFQQVRDSVQLLKQTTCQAVGIELGGWDTHGDQAPTHASLLAVLSHALRSIYDDLLNDASSILDDVVIVVESEFGRTSEENGSLGTDHGNAGVMIVMGGPVNGGVYNCDGNSWTGHPLLDNGPPGGPHYLSMVTDYRKVWMEIFEKQFGIAQQQRQDHIIWNYSSEVGSPSNYLGLL